MRIVRTEGNRIYNAASLDSAKAAKEKTDADLVKVWDAVLDGLTCPHHRQLDGQVRELDEDFEISGYKASAPGYFGIAAEDINCRCVALTKPRWDIDGSFTKRDNQSGELLEFKDARDYEDFKKKFWKTVDNDGGSGIIEEKAEAAVVDVHKVGKIDIEKYKNITDKRILTDEVIITDNRIEHIIQRRGKLFYDEYHGYFEKIVEDPDYIFKDDKEDTAIVSKCFVHKGKTVNLVLRLVVEGDEPTFKNSIITAIGESERRFAQRLRNNEPIYKKG